MIDWQDIRFAFRQLVTRPAFTLVTVLTLALGIGANTAIFSVIQGVLYETAPFDEVDRLVWMGEHSEQVPTMSVAYPNFQDWRERNRSFDALAAHRFQTFNLTGLERPEQLWAVQTSASLFPEVLRVEPLLGRVFTAAEDQPGQGAVAVVSYGFWQRRLGADDQAVGRSILLDGDPYEVIGVMPPGFVYPLNTDRVQMWLPIGHTAGLRWMKSRSNHPGIYVTGRLKAEVAFDQALDEMVALTAAMAEEFPETNTGNSVSMAPLREHVVRNLRPAVLVLTGAVFLILLIACVNVANLLLVRGTSRAQEIAVRSALGAGQWRVLKQLLTESVMLALLGGAVGIGVALVSLRLLLGSIDPRALPVIGTIGLDGSALLFAFCLSLVTGVLFGSAPAVQAIRRDHVGSLKEGSKGSQGGARQTLRNALVAAQVALALILVAGAMLFLQSFSNLIGTDPGFDGNGVLAFDLALSTQDYPEGTDQNQFMDAFIERVRAMPQVATASTTMPLLGGWQTSVLVEGQPEPAPGEGISVDITRVDADYFKVLGVDLQRGRTFDRRDHAESLGVVIVDRTFADALIGEEEPIGRRIRLGGSDDPWLEIIGVVDHVKNYGVAQESRFEVYVPRSQDPYRSATFVIKTGVEKPLDLMPAIEQELSRLSATQPIARPRLVADQMESSQIAARVLAGMLTVFGALALLLAALGIYGVMAFQVNARRREIGIRMALGAGAPQVLRWFSLLGLRLVGSGILVGLVGVYWGAPIVGAQLFGVEPRDPVTLVVLPLMLVVVAALACIGPLRRAGKVEPITALRHE